MKGTSSAPAGPGKEPDDRARLRAHTFHPTPTRGFRRRASVANREGDETVNVCLVALDFHGWNCPSGCGFGRATRSLGRALTRRGVRVTAVVPRALGQPERCVVDGIEVFSFSPTRPGEAHRWLREVDADIYHSIEPSLLTHVAQRARPARAHVVTMLDPALDGPCIGGPDSEPLSLAHWLRRRYYRMGRRVRDAVASADLRFVGARHIGEEVRRLYGLAETPAFLPRPVDVPAQVRKASVPTVCMLDRWEPRKRPELFFALAERFPEVRFIAAGSAADEAATWVVRQRWGHLFNLELRDPVSPFSRAYAELLAESWILVNPAHRTGLPASFVDAAAHGTAILSTVDPDDFASNFGLRTAPEGLGEGLADLLADSRWRLRGELGRAYVADTFSADRSVDAHLEAYRSLAGGAEASAPLPVAQMA